MVHSINIDATKLTSPSFPIPGISASLDTSAIQSLHLEPSSYVIQTHVTPNPTWNFAVTAQGLVDYAPTLDVSQGGFLTGCGSSTLGVLGFTITINATALTAVTFLVYGITGEIKTSVVHQLQLLPGQYNFRNPAGIRPLIPFEIKADGTVAYDPNFDADASPKGFLNGLGTSTIVLLGHAITIDARALTTATLHVWGIRNDWATAQVQQMRLLPGQYSFRNPPSGRPLIPFEIKADGIVDYDPDFDADASPKGFFKGLGTSTIVLLGHAITIDASALTTRTLHVYGIWNDWATSEVQHLRLLPGQYYFRNPPAGRPLIPFAIRSDGTVAYEPSFDADSNPNGFYKGLGTASIKLLGHTITVDARALALSIPSFFVNGITDPLPTADPQRLQLLPAYYAFSTPAGTGPNINFEVASEGRVSYGLELDISATPPGYLSGRWTKSLSVVGYGILIDARVYAGAVVALHPFGIVLDTSNLQLISLLPVETFRIEIRSIEPKVASFGMSGAGRIVLDDPYPFVDIRWHGWQQTMRLTTDVIRQKRECCLVLAGIDV